MLAGHEYKSHAMTRTEMHTASASRSIAATPLVLGEAYPHVPGAAAQRVIRLRITEGCALDIVPILDVADPAVLLVAVATPPPVPRLHTVQSLPFLLVTD